MHVCYIILYILSEAGQFHGALTNNRALIEEHLYCGAGMVEFRIHDGLKFHAPTVHESMGFGPEHFHSTKILNQQQFINHPVNPGCHLISQKGSNTVPKR